MRNDKLARELSAALGIEPDPALKHLPSVYTALSNGLQNANEGQQVFLTALPGGGSEDLRWAGKAEIINRAVRAADERQRQRERSYEPYGPGAF